MAFEPDIEAMTVDEIDSLQAETKAEYLERRDRIAAVRRAKVAAERAADRAGAAGKPGIVVGVPHMGGDQ